jgi:galactose mutarotase-like enzyme
MTVPLFTFEAQPGLGGLLTYVLKSADGSAEAHIVPERGAIVTKLRFGSDEVLYLDESTLIDRAKNVRGGIPVLFPNAGKLPSDEYEVDGQRYALSQHGFARKLAWKVTEATGHRDSARLVCGLGATDETMQVYPWPFAFELAFTLRSNELALEATLHNFGDAPMPHALGFHPYFRVPDTEKKLAGVRTDAKHGIDNTTGKKTYVSKIRYDVPELDLHLLDHSAHGTLMRRGSLPKLSLTWDAGFTTLVLWTLAGKDFVCVEPWEAPGGALATKQGLAWLPPQASVKRTFTIGSGVRSP